MENSCWRSKKYRGVWRSATVLSIPVLRFQCRRWASETMLLPSSIIHVSTVPGYQSHMDELRRRG